MAVALLLTLSATASVADEAARHTVDARLRPLRSTVDAYHPWTPPQTLAEWEREAAELRTQIQFAAGLWPLPEKAPLDPVVHGKVDRGDYTVEKVFFASQPGVYVTGNLYRPKGKTGRLPGVLCPHGHALFGRFEDNQGRAEQDLASGAEEFLSGARYPLQALNVLLVRMGCVVFHYDMIGNADNQFLPHAQGFNDADAALWLHSKLGLQTWNSLRALDFLASLPDVDPERLGVTGSSGGGTQTFMLCALDPRPSVAFPAVMVGTGMQGGCVCENACYLRIGTNNVAIAALFAPRPLAMSGANDWTIDIETKGLPELKQVYALYGKAGDVHAKAYPQFPHNYNQVAREMMARWFQDHLSLDPETSVQQSDFWPLTREEMSVFNDEHPRPADGLDAQMLRERLREADRKRFAAWSSGSMEAYRDIVGTAANVMLQPIRSSDAIVVEQGEPEVGLPGQADVVRTDSVVTVQGARVPVTRLSLRGESAMPRRTVIWLDGSGRSHLFDSQGAARPAVTRLLRTGVDVLSADLFLTGAGAEDENRYDTKQVRLSPDYVYGYNRPLLSERVRDIQAVVRSTGSDCDLIGTNGAGLWTLLARATLPENAVRRTVVDLEGFQSEHLEEPADVNMLPGVLKYGGLAGLTALAFPASLEVHGAEDPNEFASLTTAYKSQPGRLNVLKTPLDEDALLQSSGQAR